MLAFLSMTKYCYTVWTNRFPHPLVGKADELFSENCPWFILHLLLFCASNLELSVNRDSSITECGLWHTEGEVWEKKRQPLGGLSLLGFVSLSLGLWQVEVWQWPATLKAFRNWQWCPAKGRQARPVTCSLTHVPHQVSSEETQTKGEIERKTRH